MKKQVCHPMSYRRRVNEGTLWCRSRAEEDNTDHFKSLNETDRGRKGPQQLYGSIQSATRGLRFRVRGVGFRVHAWHRVQVKS